VRILLTGGLGFIGHHFARMFQPDHHIMILDAMTYAARHANLSEFNGALAIGNVEDARFVRGILRAFEPDWVVHMAAETHVARSLEPDREVFLRTNVIGTDVLLNEALEYWKAKGRFTAFRFLQVSTDEVYGSLAPHDPPASELTRYSPNNPYAASKAAGDHLVQAYWHTWGLPSIVTHSSNNYGTGQHPEKLIPRIIKQCLLGQPMTIHGDGLNVRDWLHVEDNCRGLMAALERGFIGGTYNFGGNCERTNRQIANYVWANCFGRGPERNMVEYTPDRPGNDRRYALNSTKALIGLKWQPGLAIEHRIGEVVQWHLNNPSYEDEYDTACTV